jgi:hypothetical protein
MPVRKTGLRVMQCPEDVESRICADQCFLEPIIPSFLRKGCEFVTNAPAGRSVFAARVRCEYSFQSEYEANIYSLRSDAANIAS